MKWKTLLPRGVRHFGSQPLPAIIALALSAGSGLALDALVVTRDGKGLKADNVRTEDGKVVFKDLDSGSEKSMPTNTVDGVIPFVQKGKDYDPEEVKANLELIKRLKTRHNGLTKYFGQLNSDWTLVQKAASLDKEIDSLKDAFFAGPKTSSSYKTTSTSMGLLKLKDVQGKYTELIDEALASIKKEFLKVAVGRLSSCAATNKTIEGLKGVVALTQDVTDFGDDRDKKKAADALNQARENVCAAVMKDASAVYAGKADIESYLKSRDMLRRLLEEVVATPDQRRNVEAALGRQIEDIAKAMPTYRFDGGYPLNAEDQQVLGDTSYLGRGLKIKSTGLDPECIIYPLAPQEVVQVGQPVTIPLRMVFNRAQPTNRMFSVVLMMNGQKDSFVHPVDQGKLQIKDGRVDVSVKEDFSLRPKGFVPAVEADGTAMIYLFVTYRQSEALIPLSLACGVKGKN